MKVLIIGANSMLGQEVIKQLLFNDVKNIVGVFNQNKNRIEQKINYLNINEIHQLKNDFDVVYLISAYIPKDTIERDKLFKVNVQLVQEISSKFTNSKIIYSSTVSVYKPSQLVFENSDLEPINEYAISKLWGEKIVRNHNNYAIVRISSMYGVSMNCDTFLPFIIKKSITENKITLFGDGSRAQNYVHVSHVAKTLISASKSTSETTFLAVSKSSYTNKEIAELIQKNLTTTPIISYQGIDNSPSFLYDNEKTVSTLKIKDTTSITKEINELIEWIKKS